jgi:hypothetical protein
MHLTSGGPSVMGMAEGLTHVLRTWRQTFRLSRGWTVLKLPVGAKQNVTQPLDLVSSLSHFSLKTVNVALATLPDFGLKTVDVCFALPSSLLLCPCP